MNNTYKLVWNSTLQAWVVASELAKSHKKSRAVKLAAAVMAAVLSGSAWAVPAVDALPTGEVIPGGGGAATFDRSVTNQLTINQSTSKLITNWTGFNIGSSAKVIFNQPDANSIALNRISGGTSEIFGQLNSNGQLFLVNSAGFTFGATAQVNVGSLVASAFSISDANFNAGNYQFTRIGTNANVDNYGSITSTAGDVTFLAPFSYNYGSIVANGGNVNVVNAQDVNLSNTLAPVINTASNTIGLIRSLGSIQANSVSSVGGRILLRGDTSTATSSISLAGRLQADDSISATGKTINLSNNLQLNGNTSLTAADNINLRAVVDVASNKALNLTHGADAGEGFYLSSGAKLNLGSGTTYSLNGQNYTVVYNISQLQAMGADDTARAGRYVLANDIDATATSTWNSGAGFAPIGSYGWGNEPFSGKLDGLGHTVKSLYINRPADDNVGLFGYAAAATIQNIGLLNPQITGGDYVAALAGFVRSGFAQPSVVHNSYVEGGSISGGWRVGGLLGQLYSIGANTSLSQSYSNTTVNGSGEITGGLVADLSSADGAVASISNSYSTGLVNGGNSSGGLVGYNGTSTAGSTQISNSYSTSKIVSAGIQGALVGQNYASSGSISIDSSYASGQVSGAVAGGLVGRQTAAGGSVTVSNSYWDSDTTGQGSAVAQNNGGTLTNVNAVSGHGGANPPAFDQANYTNLNFSTSWFTVGGQTRPMLRAFLAASSSGNNAINVPINTLYQLQAITLNTGNSYKYNLTQNIDASTTQASVTAGNAGNYADIWGGKGFVPIASTSVKMQAGLDGGSHIISGLGINRPGIEGVGLIAGAVVNTIKNIGLQDVSIVGGQYTGGLVGYGIQIVVDNSFVTGQVTGSNVYAGGLIGLNDGASIISNTYADVDVHGDYYAGGLLGYNGSTGTVLNSYASGKVTATTPYAGGLIALNAGTVTNSYWNTESSGQVFSSGGTGRTTAQMQSLSNYSGWNIDAQAGTGTTWRIYDGLAAPLLRSFLTPLAVTAGETKIYDGTSYTGGITPADLSANLANILGGNYSGAAVGARHVGSYALNVTGLYSNQQGYDLTVNGSGSLVITPAQLVIGSADVIKTYDATTAANGSAIAVNGTQLFTGDSLTGGNFAFTNQNAGIGKTVTVSGVTVNDGNGGGNYVISYANNTSSTINKANLSIGSQLSAPYRQYNGTTSADATAVAQSTLYGSDSISGGTFTYDNKNYGIGKTVTTSNVTVNDGNGSNNYNVTYVDNTNGAILEADLLVSSTDASKVYDGSTSATATAVAQSTLYGSDSISGGTFTYDTKHAGTGKTVTTSNVTVNDGNGGNNYRVIYVDNTNGSISKANLVVSTSDVSKVFDGTTAAAGIAQAVSGTQLFGSDSLSGGTFAYDNRNTGTGKTVTVSGVTVNDGNNGDNYNLSYADNTTSSISKADLLVTSTDASKVYDGTTAATATATSGGLYGSDSLSGGTFTYDDRNAGTGKTVTTSNVTVNDGNSGNNYNVIYVDNTSSSISKASLLVTSTGVSKTYDGTTLAAGSAVVTGGTQLFAGDSLSGGDFNFGDKHAGIGKTIQVSNVAVDDGNGGNNYDLSYQDSLNGVITQALLNITSTDVSKVYDGTTTANGTLYAANGTQLFAGDSISGGSYSFTDKKAGNFKTLVLDQTVTVNDGNNGQNYIVSYATNTNSSISKASLVVSTIDVSKTYDGTTTATGIATVINGTQLFGSDSLSGGTFTYDNRNTGTGKTVTVAGVSVNDGNNGDNYNLSYADNNTSSISKADLHIAAAQVTKVYDGTTSATGTAQANSTLFGSDGISGGTLSFDTKHAGTGKTVSISGVTVNDGNNGNNYNVIYDANTSGVITPASLSISTTNVSKTYDGTTTAAGHTVLANGTQLFGSDSISGGTFTFGNKNVGTAKTVTVSGVTVSDGNGGNNYNVSYVNNTGSSISKALLLLQAANLARVYDGTTDANTTINIVSGQLFGSDSYSGGKFQFVDKNVGNNKQLVLTQNVSLNDGNNGGNYLVAYVPSTGSSISPASLNIQAVTDSKVYDGKVNSSASPSVTGLFGSDRVTGLFQQFANDNAGTGKIINIKSGFVVDDGNGGNNYVVNTTSTNTGVITPASLTLSAVTDSKVFEGNLHSTGNPLVNGLVQGDRVTGLFQQFADRNAGTGKTINIKPGYVVDDGNGGNNYTVTLVANTTGVITPKQLLINAVAGSKVYDGGITSTGKPVVTGLAHGDRVTGLFQQYDNKQVGTGKRLYIRSGYVVRDGNNGGNYDVVITENNAGVITAH